ncbi:ATP-binding protein [Uliginosibacterium sp. 31-16]|uniref:HAMP domain-containing sensor histidine kinase n=1 Tax=Uliginosibacterium sp. 31-16 TaxID=3068315 RepID=UPI00273F9321|nr:ATP-binding protein [Uliginosibacterium sp. 31-16]MDP5239310.1 ATP-binding protein [Uliginosibacterium sp. 31-16]
MGRLFWKIFAGFWLTLLLTVIGVTAALAIQEEARRSEESVLAAGPRSSIALRTAWSVAQYGGESALRSLLESWPAHDGAPPLVVNEEGADLLGREVPAEALGIARERLAEWHASRDGERVGDWRKRGVRAWQDTAGHEWLMFFPLTAARAPERAPLLPYVRIEAPIALAIAALLASLAVSALLARHFSRPIRKLQDAFLAASHGQLDVRVAQSMDGRRDEIGELGREFDGMAQQLQQLMGSQSRLLHDVSHELRSPLARLQVAVGLARQSPAQVDAALSRIERESERLDALIGEILTLARLEAQSVQHADDYVDVVELLDSVVEDARFEAEGSARRIVFTSSVDGEMIIRARGELLHRAVENVLRNALRHTPPDSVVELNLSRDSTIRALHITIADAGAGVAEAELATIFEPFHRGENAGSGGYGLGLAIARRAIEAHGGQVRARNRSTGGLEVHIDLPASMP